MATGTWIAIALLTAFWWALGLFVLASLADVSPWVRRRASSLFEWLEGRGAETASGAAIARVVAA